MVVMVMVVMPPIAPEGPERRPDHEASSVVVVVVVVMIVVLRQLNVAFLRCPALLFIHRLQQRACIRDRLQQLGIGVGS